MTITLQDACKTTNSLQDILRVERLISDLLKSIQNSIVNETENREYDGMKKINNSCCITKQSLLKNNIWSVEYYHPHAQAAHIAAALSGIKTATAFMDKLTNMIENRYIEIGKNKYHLNDTTISILIKYRDASTKK